MHIPTDKDKIIEMEKYRISMRHLAVMMGKNPDEFTFEDQQKAIRYLMPGYFRQRTHGWRSGNPCQNQYFQVTVYLAREHQDWHIQ